MVRMLRRSCLRLSAFVAVLILVVSATGLRAQQDSSKWGRKYKVPPPSARIEITILRDSNGKPIEGAAVIFHPMEGDKDKGVLELKTNEDGKAIIDVLPIGDTVRMQVIANGFQTFGQDYKVDKSEMSMEIRLKRPGQQYSIYKDTGAAANSGSGSGAGKSTPPPQNPAPPAPGDKGAGSQTNTTPPAAQPTPNPNQAQTQ